MNISCHHLLSHSRDWISDRVLTESTSLQQRVTSVALIALGCLVLILTAYSCYSNYSKLRAIISGKEGEKEIEREFDPQDEIASEKKGSPGVSSPEKKKTVSERLDKNRRYALEQQRAEKAKGFTVQGELILPKKDIDCRSTESAKLQAGVSSSQGTRDIKNEDKMIIGGECFKVNGKSVFFNLYGVCDGHGGVGAADFVHEKIYEYLAKELQTNNQEKLTEEGIYKSLKDCCIALDRDYTGQEGTTLTFAMILEDKIWVANVGDSRTIFVKDGVAIQASEDALPSIERYKRKIEERGGRVTCERKEFPLLKKTLIDIRVYEDLSVARAIGDKYSPMVNAEGQNCISPNPKISCYSLSEFKGGYLVSASDGLYQVATTNEVGQAITQMAGKGESLKEMSRQLVLHAIKHGSSDHVTAVVVKL